MNLSENHKPKGYVFVVCGDREHIDTLHFSLQALKKVSSLPIWVITDQHRNAISIEHHQLIDVRVDPLLNHHQASIFLKTSVHRYLPPGLYAYLDSDVVALDKRIDSIFNFYQTPITFAKDHCCMDEFSPTAMDCGCATNIEARKEALGALFKQFLFQSRPVEHPLKKEALLRRFETMKKQKLKYAWISIRFWLSPRRFWLHEDAFFDKQARCWKDANNQVILYEGDPVKEIESASEFRMDRMDGKTWRWGDEEVFSKEVKCNHLADAIFDTFGIETKPLDFHHWNGGVFLFDHQSHAFLEDWHKKSVQIMNRSPWKTRDQGTLIATTMKWGLTNHPTLPGTYNWIADHQGKDWEYFGGLSFRNSHSAEEQSQPCAVHVYHHWGDHRWTLWNDIESRTGIYLPKEEQYINGLWIGNQLSALEWLTIYSFLAQGYRFRLWMYQPLSDPLPQGLEVANASEIIPESQVFSYKKKNQFGHGIGSYAGFSDLFRYKLLYEKGGWWTDMDVTCVQNFFIDKPYFFREHHEFSVVGNVMKTPSKSALMADCYEEALRTIHSENTDWHLPIKILNEKIDKHGLGHYRQKGCSNPDQWVVTSQWIYHDLPIPKDWFFIHWQHEEWRRRKLSKTYFYYRGTLAKLLSEYGLFEMPKTKKEKAKADFHFKPSFRHWLRMISA